MNKIDAFLLGFLLFFSGCSGMTSIQPYEQGLFGGGENTVKGNGKAFFKNIHETFKKNRYKKGLFGGGRNEKYVPVADKVAAVAAKDMPQTESPSPENSPQPPVSPAVALQKSSEKQTVLSIGNMIERLNSNRDPDDQTLEKKTSQAPVVETVDIFAPEKSNSSQKIIPSTEPSGTRIQEELDIYKQAESFYRQGQPALALEKLRQIEYLTANQIKVHVRFLMGEIMFKQGQYDLAMQNYQEVITQHAFSGLVIKSLERLIVCSKKLNQEEMRAKYHSILYNFFES